MNTLIQMYVYFDKNGDIKAISPHEDLNFVKDYSYAMMPISEVEPFLVGKLNPFDYLVKKNNKLTGPVYIISNKVSTVRLTRSLDSYLTKISDSEDRPAIRVVVDIKRHKISLKLSDGFRDLYENGTVEEQEDIASFIDSDISTICITGRNNPYKLLHSFTFLPKELFDRNALHFDYPETIDLRNSSAYTKRLVNSYRYMIKEVRNGI